MAGGQPEIPNPLPPDVDHRFEYMGGIIAITVVSCVIVWVRMYTRLVIGRNAGWDDWIMFASTPLTLLTNGFLLHAFHLGLGRHIYYLPQSQIPECFKYLWLAEPTNLFALFTVRISIALFFLRLIPVHHKAYRNIIWGTIWALILSDIYVSVTYFIQCRPIKKVWLPDTEGTCLPDAVFAVAPWAYQGVSIVSDIVLVGIPCAMLKGLRMPRATKIGVLVLCGLGVFTCACAIAKTALLTALFDKEEHDRTWSLAQLCFWAPMEICTGMICGSIPCLKPLYNRIRGTSTQNSSSTLPSSYASNKHNSKYGIMASTRGIGIAGTGAGMGGIERSKSEESILPGAGDIEMGSVSRGGDVEEGGSVEGSGKGGGGGGILRTTEVEFRSERLG